MLTGWIYWTVQFAMCGIAFCIGQILVSGTWGDAMPSSSMDVFIIFLMTIAAYEVGIIGFWLERPRPSFRRSIFIFTVVVLAGIAASAAVIELSVQWIAEEPFSVQHAIYRGLLISGIGWLRRPMRGTPMIEQV